VTSKSEAAPLLGAPLLEIRDLSVWLPTRRGAANAVDGVSLHVDSGEILGIAGESGSGKTMTALTLLGLLPHGARTTGSVVFDGEQRRGRSQRFLRTVRGARIAMVSQDPSTSLHPILTIGTQLTEHMRHHLGLSKEAARDRAVELLETVRIPDARAALDSYPGQFSGGMRQRIAIAVALAARPTLLLADEPTTALDVTVQAGILRLLDTLRVEQNLAVMIITHDLGVMSALADRVVVVYGRGLAETGPPRELLSAPRLPYTRGLLDALPHPELERAALRPIGGSPPSLGAVPDGCPFHPRCATDRPVWRQIAPGHDLACDPDPLRVSV